MTFFERFDRMQTADYRDLEGLTLFNATSRNRPQLIDMFLRQSAVIVLPFGLIVLALIAAAARAMGMAGKAGSLLDGTPLRLAAQVYIVVFVALAYWFWLATGRF
jgi:hypothetical protein